MSSLELWVLSLERCYLHNPGFQRCTLAATALDTVELIIGPPANTAICVLLGKLLRHEAVAAIVGAGAWQNHHRLGGRQAAARPRAWGRCSFSERGLRPKRVAAETQKLKVSAEEGERRIRGAGRSQEKYEVWWEGEDTLWHCIQRCERLGSQAEASLSDSGVGCLAINTTSTWQDSLDVQYS